MRIKRPNQKGQSLIEYLIIVSLIAVGSIAIVRTLGQNVYARFGNIANALQNKSESIQVDDVTESQYKKRNLNNFFKGAAGKGGGSDD